MEPIPIRAWLDMVGPVTGVTISGGVMGIRQVAATIATDPGEATFWANRGSIKKALIFMAIKSRQIAEIVMT